MCFVTSTGRVAVIIEVDESAFGPLRLLHRGAGTPVRSVPELAHSFGGISTAWTCGARHGVDACGPGRRPTPPRSAPPRAPSKRRPRPPRPWLALSFEHRPRRRGRRRAPVGPTLLTWPQEDRQATRGRFTRRDEERAKLRGYSMRSSSSTTSSTRQLARSSETRHVSIGDALMTGGRVVAHVLDTPLRLAEAHPGHRRRDAA